MILLHILALVLAVGVTPWLWARFLTPSNDPTLRTAWWGAAMVGLNCVAPLGLHLSAINITANSLTSAHLILAGISLAATFMTGMSSTEQQGRASNHVSFPPFIILTAVLFAILIIPVTHIAGIDTYKWQDLAGNVAVERRISWLIHPLSLFGFTPRSYPSAQPLVLATIEILGHTGVDWGFYVLSIVFGITGLAGAFVLGRHLFQSDRLAAWFAFFYVFAPVFMRYNYWATGRGLILALLPLYLLLLLRSCFAAPREGRCLPAIAGTFALTLLLALSHKAGLVGAILIPVLFLLSPALTIIRNRWAVMMLFMIVLTAGLLVAGGNPVAFGWRLITRFGWMGPLTVMGLFCSPALFASPTSRAMWAGLSATVILSCTTDMYGALVALPFVVFAATAGFGWLIEKWPGAVTARTTIALTLMAALAIVVNQATDSPNESVYRAAQFLEQHDPRGPYRIEAPGKVRTQMQAYVSGCPRFTVTAGTETHLTIPPLPRWAGSLHQNARRWIDYLRTSLDLSGAATDWYGTGDKVYYVTVGDEGIKPPQSKLIFTHGNVSVFDAP